MSGMMRSIEVAFLRVGVILGGIALTVWGIVGGESGHGARPCDKAWVSSIVEQCAVAGVECFVKQLGANVTLNGHGGCDLHARK